MEHGQVNLLYSEILYIENMQWLTGSWFYKCHAVVVGSPRPGLAPHMARKHATVSSLVTISTIIVTIIITIISTMITDNVKPCFLC